MLVGWISIRKEDTHILEKMGITVSQWDKDTETWERCIVPDKAVDKLDKEWGKSCIWGLKQLVGEQNDSR